MPPKERWLFVLPFMDPRVPVFTLLLGKYIHMCVYFYFIRYIINLIKTYITLKLELNNTPLFLTVIILHALADSFPFFLGTFK